MQRADQHIWRTESGRHVPAGHRDAAVLAYAPGDEVPAEVLADLGGVDQAAEVAASPAYVFRLLDALAGDGVIDFGGVEVPADVQAYITTLIERRTAEQLPPVADAKREQPDVGEPAEALETTPGGTEHTLAADPDVGQVADAPAAKSRRPAADKRRTAAGDK